LLLAVFGTIGTALIGAAVSTWLFKLPFLEGLLLGAILAATDGAAIFALLRGTRLSPRLASTLEAEAGFNDPVAVLLVLVTIELILNRRYDLGDVITFLVREVGIGLALGVGIGWLASAGAKHAARLPTGLALVASLATAAIAYGSAGALGGSGFLAVYMTGLALGDADGLGGQGIPAFHDGLASVAEIGMFLTLGLLVFPSQLGDVAVKGLLLAAIVTLVARPVAATIATWRQGFSPRERVLLGWAGLRGAVPVILATFPVIRHVSHSIEFFNIVFFAVLVSATVQGLTIGPLASRLGVSR
jgi:cell volume regulation protein A